MHRYAEWVRVYDSLCLYSEWVMNRRHNPYQKTKTKKGLSPKIGDRVINSILWKRDTTKEGDVGTLVVGLAT